MPREARVAAALLPGTHTVAGAVVGADDDGAVRPCISLCARALAEDALAARRALPKGSAAHNGVVAVQ